MLTVNPEHNKPQKCVCDKCGKNFIRSPWSSVYSTNKRYLYRYHKTEPLETPDMPCLVALCGDCEMEELNAGNVSMILY